jgi:prepilin-type N-terminal cleavage/methylation domain-containing protein
MMTRRQQRGFTLRRDQRGFTLMELIIGITLMGALSAGMLMAMRNGLLTMERTNMRLDQNRRAVGALALIRRQITGTIPARGACPGRAEVPVEFFRGDGNTLLLVTSESILQGSRGYPQIARYQVRPNPDGTVRLEVVEHIYSGPPSTITHCALEQGQDGVPLVLYERLAAAHFAYYMGDPYTRQPLGWVGNWQQPYMPLAVRIELTPAVGSAPRLPMSTVTIPLRTSKEPGTPYKDEETVI